MSLLMSMLKIVCISCFKRSVRKKTTREKWKNINDLLISKTRKDIWSCCQNSINNTAFDTQLGKIFKKKNKPVARIPVRMACYYVPRRPMLGFDSSDSSSEYEDTDEECEYYVDHTQCHMHPWQNMHVCFNCKQDINFN